MRGLGVVFWAVLHCLAVAALALATLLWMGGCRAYGPVVGGRCELPPQMRGNAVRIACQARSPRGPGMVCSYLGYVGDDLCYEVIVTTDCRAWTIAESGCGLFELGHSDSPPSRRGVSPGQESL